MKLLVATEFPPNASGGGPAVVRQMLRDVPAADLSWWSCLPEREARFGQKVSRHFCAKIPAKLLPQRRLSRLKSALLETLWAPLAGWHLARTCREVNPDAIWVIPHNWSILPLASALLNAGAPYHVTVQDYVDVHGQMERFGAARCRRMAALADTLFERATTRDATSHPMIADLLARTGAPAAQMLHAGLEEDDFAFLSARPGMSGDEIRIAYAGTILVPREFAAFVEALQQIRATLPRPLSLQLFGSHSYAGAAWFDAAWMREHGNLAEPELLAALRTCTWGFAPMSLRDHDPRYNRFSFPTKFITYLAAGLPVITLGHPESSVVQMASHYRVGPALSALDAVALAAALAAPHPWEEHRAEIVRCARTEFDAARMRHVLRDCFAQGAQRAATMRW